MCRGCKEDEYLVALDGYFKMASLPTGRERHLLLANNSDNELTSFFVRGLQFEVAVLKLKNQTISEVGEQV